MISLLAELAIVYLGAFKAAEEAVRRCPTDKKSRKLRLSVTVPSDQYEYKDDDIQEFVHDIYIS